MMAGSHHSLLILIHAFMEDVDTVNNGENINSFGTWTALA